MPIIRSSILYLCYCHIWCVMPWLLVVGGQVQVSRLCVRDGGNCSSSFPHPGRIACCPAPDRRPPATKALHTICGNNTSIDSSSWWWAYKCPKHVEQIISAIKHLVASRWFSSLRLKGNFFTSWNIRFKINIFSMYLVSTPVIYLAVLKFKLPSFLTSRSKMAELKGDFPDSFSAIGMLILPLLISVFQVIFVYCT